MHGACCVCEIAFLHLPLLDDLFHMRPRRWTGVGRGSVTTSAELRTPAEYVLTCP